MIGLKVICDDPSNETCCVVGQEMFSLREINRIEREICSYLEWVLNVKAEALSEFETEVKRDYGVGGLGTCTRLEFPYPLSDDVLCRARSRGPDCRPCNCDGYTCVLALLH